VEGIGLHRLGRRTGIEHCSDDRRAGDTTLGDEGIARVSSSIFMLASDIDSFELKDARPERQRAGESVSEIPRPVDFSAVTARLRNDGCGVLAADYRLPHFAVLTKKHQPIRRRFVNGAFRGGNKGSMSRQPRQRQALRMRFESQ
jgi:hypothetical protein